MEKDIYEFPLAWRWTQSTHNVLPESVMSQLQPFSTEEAARLGERHRGLFKKGSLNRDLFYSLKRVDTTDMASSFLAMLEINDSTTVLMSWNQDTAIRATWGIFRQYWDDFCYPGSDDVTIVPEDDAWMLFYCHEDIFEFGMRKKAKG